MNDTESKRARRKTKYNSLSMPDDLIKYMNKGLSNLEICAKFNVSDETFRLWRKDYPEFEEAYKIGHPQRFAFLMEMADQSFLYGQNDKGYKHWLKKVSYMYKDYDPKEALDSRTQNTLNIGNINILQYQEKPIDELNQLLQSKLNLLPHNALNINKESLDDRNQKSNEE